MARGIKRRVRSASKRLRAEISAMSKDKFGAGLASEGYLGGYRDALSDILLLLEGVEPTDYRGFWKESDQ